MLAQVTGMAASLYLYTNSDLLPTPCSPQPIPHSVKHEGVQLPARLTHASSAMHDTRKPGRPAHPPGMTICRWVGAWVPAAAGKCGDD